MENRTFTAQWQRDWGEWGNLAAVIAFAETIEPYQELYTYLSWARFEQGLSAARIIHNRERPSSNQYEIVRSRLITAIENLELLPPPLTESPHDKSTLRQLVAEAEMRVESYYTALSWARLDQALRTAQNVLNNPRVSLSQLNNTTDRLYNALADLVLIPPPPVRDFTALDAAIARAEGLVQSHWTSTSWARLESRLSLARTVRNNPNSQSHIDNTANNLNDAIDNLIRR